MKQFNKFLALALVAGVCSTNLLAMDASSSSVHAPFVFGAGFPELAEPEKASGKGSVAINKRRKAVHASVRERSVKFWDLEKARKERIQAGLDARKARKAAAMNERRGISVMREELTEVDALILEMRAFAGSLRTAFSKDPADGAMSPLSDELFAELIAPYIAYAVQVDTFADALQENKAAIEAEIAKLGDVANPASFVPSIPAGMKPALSANAQSVGFRLVANPKLATALYTVLGGALAGATALFGVAIAPVAVPLAVVEVGVPVVAAIGGVLGAKLS